MNSRGNIAKLRGSSATFDRRTHAAEQSAPTPPQGVAHASRVPVARRSRSGLIVSAAAVVVGSTAGGALALRDEPARLPASAPTNRPADLPTSPQPRAPTSPQPPAPASASPDAMRSSPSSSSPPAPRAAAAAIPGSASAPPGPALSDLHTAVVVQIKAVVMRFVIWSHDHPGARCPDAATLGTPAADPWGRSLRILCADQPADQVAGVLSLGPDGLPGTPDDIASWTLGPEVTHVLRGAPWGSSGSVSASAGPARPPATVPHAAGPRGASATAASTKPSASAGAGGNDTDGDGIPDRR